VVLSPPCGFFSFSLHFLAHFRLTFSLNIEQQHLRSLCAPSDGKVSPSIGYVPGRWENWGKEGWSEAGEVFTAFPARYLANFVKDLAGLSSCSYPFPSSYVLSPCVHMYLLMCICSQVCVGLPKTLSSNITSSPCDSVPAQLCYVRVCHIKIIISGVQTPNLYKKLSKNKLRQK